MASVEMVLSELGLELPPVPKPVASYIPAIKTGNLVMTSGQLPMKDGVLVAEGLVGKDVTLEQAQGAARIATLNALAAVKGVAGDLGRIQRLVKVNVFVAAPADFHQHPKVANGASELLQQIFGERGVHARAAVGCPSLPLNAPVEVELTVEIT